MSRATNSGLTHSGPFLSNSTVMGVSTALVGLLQQAHARSMDDQRLAERTAQVGRFRELAALMA